MKCRFLNFKFVETERFFKLLFFYYVKINLFRKYEISRFLTFEFHFILGNCTGHWCLLPFTREWRVFLLMNHCITVWIKFEIHGLSSFNQVEDSVSIFWAGNFNFSLNYTFFKLEKKLGTILWIFDIRYNYWDTSTFCHFLIKR